MDATSSNIAAFTMNPLIKPTKPKLFTLYTPKNTKTNLLSLNCCLKKPDTNTHNNVPKNQNPTVEPKVLKNSSNEPISSDIAPSSSDLTTASTGLVFDLGLKDSWDSVEIGSPVVKRFLSDEEERWYMWFHGRSHGSVPDSVGLAVSSNGVHWERGNGAVESGRDSGLVMKCSEDWWAFDTMSIWPSEIVVMASSKVRTSSSVYWLYYTGYSHENVDLSDQHFGFDLENPERFFPTDDSAGGNGGKGKTFKSLPGLAISQDGRHWARIEGEHHSGALFEVGSKEEWDSLYITSPQVVFHSKGDLRMYYHSFDVETGQFSIGIARSRDGIRWIKLGKIIGGGEKGGFDEFGVVNGHALRNKKDGKYVMVYEGVGANGKRGIGLAVSSDGLKDWRRVQEDAILEASDEDGWDCKGVGSPCLVHMDGEEDEWRLYYRGVGIGGRTGIGTAVSVGKDVTRFNRWSGFRL